MARAARREWCATGEIRICCPGYVKRVPWGRVFGTVAAAAGTADTAGGDIGYVAFLVNDPDSLGAVPRRVVIPFGLLWE